MDKTGAEIYQAAVNKLYDEITKGMFKPDNTRALVEVINTFSLSPIRKKYGQST